MSTLQHISVGFCIAYDWTLLRYSIPLIYDNVDRIYISYDKELISWSGKPFEMDLSGLKVMISNLDISSKITLIDEDFHSHSKVPGENEVYQRRKLSEHMGEGNGWQLQLDADEYPLEMERLTKKLRSWKVSTSSFNVCLPLINLFKKVENGFLVIQPTSEWIQVASLTPEFTLGRRNGLRNIYVNAPLIHQSWARSDDEIQQKITNWGHSNDFDIKGFYKTWQNLDLSNYQNMVNFHPINQKVWKSLLFVDNLILDEINEEAIIKLRSLYPTRFKILIKNNRYIAKIRQLLNLP